MTSGILILVNYLVIDVIYEQVVYDDIEFLHCGLHVTLAGEHFQLAKPLIHIQLSG